MDLPPSGWYPDPYGTPDLLRWWDGLNWTHHTHPFVDASVDTGGVGAGGAGAGGVGAAGDVGAAAALGGSGGLGGAGVLSGASGLSGGSGVSGGRASAGGVAATAVQSSVGGGWAASDRVIDGWAGTDWPTGDQLAATKPPQGPRTEPQPALPDTAQPGIQPGVQATRYQPAVQATTTQAAVAATAYQAPVQPTTVQAPVAPTAMQQPVSNGWGTQGVQLPGGAAGAGGPGGPGGSGGGDGTQVLFLGDDAWRTDSLSQHNPYGYQQAQRRRKLWLIGGISAGTAVAIAIIVVVANSMGGSGGGAAADSALTTPPAPTHSASAAATEAAPSPSATPSASAPAPTSMLSDSQSGLSYGQLATPWQGGCPSALSSAFPWTAGENATAGQINGGQTTWYGEACSGPLPSQYNYTSAADLENTATNVASTLGNAYYTAMPHTSSPVLSQPVSVSGHPGWEIEYQLTYTNAAAQGATWTTEEGAVEVVDTGTGNTPVVFFASVPNTLGASTLDSLVSSLQLSVVPNPISGGADGSPAPGGSPGAGG